MTELSGPKPLLSAPLCPSQTSHGRVCLAVQLHMLSFFLREIFGKTLRKGLALQVGLSEEFLCVSGLGGLSVISFMFV